MQKQFIHGKLFLWMKTRKQIYFTNVSLNSLSFQGTELDYSEEKPYLIISSL